MSTGKNAARATASQVRALQEALLGWYRRERRDLPWRQTRDPYAIWVSEVMLQQTRVETVVPYYERFLARFPTVFALAEAAPDEVLSSWSGLGYYRRARLLHQGAQAVVRGGGAVPRTRAELRRVPGIGTYTGGAVASIAFGEPVGLVDGNVARVLARLFGLDDDMRGAGMRRARAIADDIVARAQPGAWNQALMELGATVCVPRAPRCEACPVALHCRAHAEGRAHELPVLSPKRAPIERRLQAVVATDGGGRILLVKRRADGLFGGLWEPPIAEGATRATLTAWVPVAKLRRAGKVDHVLSHRRFAVDVHAGELRSGADALAFPAEYEEARLVALRDGAVAGVGISTFARKIVAAGAPRER